MRNFVTSRGRQNGRARGRPRDTRNRMVHKLDRRPKRPNSSALLTASEAVTSARKSLRFARGLHPSALAGLPTALAGWINRHQQAAIGPVARCQTRGADGCGRLPTSVIQRTIGYAPRAAEPRHRCARMRIERHLCFWTIRASPSAAKRGAPTAACACPHLSFAGLSRETPGSRNPEINALAGGSSVVCVFGPYGVAMRPYGLSQRHELTERTR